MKLSKELKMMARATGLCDQWFSTWEEDTDLEGLIDKFINGQDFCIKNDYPSLEYCRGKFDKDELRELHVFLDKICSEDIKYNTYIVMGNSEVTFRSDSYDSSTIYVRHNSIAHIKVTRHSYVNIRAYDNADIYLEVDPSSKATVIKKSEKARITAIGDNVKIK